LNIDSLSFIGRSRATTSRQMLYFNSDCVFPLILKQFLVHFFNQLMWCI